jgi:outer membrane receptor protein involved in Fe transport
MKKTKWSAFYVFMSAASASAHAQTAPAIDGESQSGEGFDGNDIVVTAQKIEQRISDVPITISAVTGERMRELGATNLGELSNFVPGLNYQNRSANAPAIVIRGITSDAGTSQAAARVTVYYNGVDISRGSLSYQDIYDMERIEVIKGPQATLFGTASAVGAISAISARPKKGFSAALTAGVGNYGQYQVDGHINVGSDTLAGRVAFAYKKRDGYVNNLAPGQQDLASQDQRGIRGSLRWTPSDSFSADLILTYDGQRNSGTPYVSRALPTQSGPADPFGDAFLGGSPLSASVLGASKLGLHRDVYDGNLTLKWEMADDWTLTLVNGYRKVDSLEVFDADGSAAWFLELSGRDKGWQASQETRFSYNSDTFRGSFGFNIFRESGSQRADFSSEEGTFIQCTLQPIPGLPCVAPGGAVTAAQATSILTGGLATVIPYSASLTTEGKNDSYSVFFDGTWIPTPRLEVTAGVRAEILKRRSGFLADVPNSILAGVSLLPFTDTAGQTLRDAGSYQAFLPRVNALFKFTPTFNGFATVSKGHRSPVIQVQSQGSPSGPIPNIDRLPAETVWNYELGLKLATKRISGSLGVFYQSYKNFQVSDVIGGLFVTRNAGSATNWGVEAEASSRLADWLNIFANAGYFHGGIGKNLSNGVYAGAKFRSQPTFQSAAGFTINAPLGGDLAFFATPTVTYRSRMYFGLPNSLVASQGALTLVNLRGGVSWNEGRVEVSGFVRNLTNKKYLSDSGNTGSAFGYSTTLRGEPRLYGVEVTGKF